MSKRSLDWEERRPSHCTKQKEKEKQKEGKKWWAQPEQREEAKEKEKKPAW